MSSECCGKLDYRMAAVSQLHSKYYPQDLMNQSFQAEVRDIWLIENNEGLTALRLAAALSQADLFKLISGLDGVYKHLDHVEGVFDSVLYDVTEIDPTAFLQWNGGKKSSDSMSLAHSSPNVPRDTEEMVGLVRKNVFRRMSVLEIICEANSDKETFGVLTTQVVQNVVNLKWIKYRVWFWAWAVFHFFFMSLVSVYTVYRGRIIGFEMQHVQPAAVEKEFVAVVAAVLPITPFVVVPLELLVKIRRKHPWKPVKLLHHNGTYRLVLVFFSLCLAADGIWFWSGVAIQRNYAISFALISGWWFQTFFLRPFRPFSFFTVMLQRIFFRDMLRFMIIIVLMWAAFSIAMHGTYMITSNPMPEESYKDLWTSMLTMFQLLVGMADTDDALPGKKDGFAVFLYVTYILLTYILVLNALIALTANTCTTISKDRECQYKLQRLSVLLMIENLIPFDGMQMLHRLVMKKTMTMFDFRNQRSYEETRFVLKIPEADVGRGRSQAKTSDEKGDPHSALIAAFVKQKLRLDNMWSSTIRPEGRSLGASNASSSSNERNVSPDDTSPSHSRQVRSDASTRESFLRQHDAENEREGRRHRKKRAHKSSRTHPETETQTTTTHYLSARVVE